MCPPLIESTIVLVDMNIFGASIIYKNLHVTCDNCFATLHMAPAVSLVAVVFISLVAQGSLGLELEEPFKPSNTSLSFTYKYVAQLIVRIRIQKLNYRKSV